MEEVKRVTVYTWKYDNGAWGYAAKQKKGGWLEQNGYTTKRKVQECYKEYKMKPDFELVKKKIIDVPGGLSCVKWRYSSKEQDNQEKNGMEAMLALLNSCGTTPDAKREMLRLVASVLAGYCARVSSGEYPHFLSQLQRRSPIIVVKQAPFAGEVVEKVIRSLALNTTESVKWWFSFSSRKIKCKYNPVLPKKFSDEKIMDRAFLKLEGCNKRMLPQYRDATLMIYGWFLRGRDGRRLQLMNRWISMVVYGVSRKQVVTTPVEIDGKELVKANCQWDEDDVKLSVIRYARYVLRKSCQKEKWKKMLRTEFSKYDVMINSYNQNSDRKIQAAERYHISMQLLSLHLFLKACVRNQDLKQDQAAELENEWCTVLLPGCKILSSTSDFVEQEDPEKENNIKEEFESTLMKIFEKGFPAHFYISEEVQGETDERTDMWGDIGLAPQEGPPAGVYYVRFSKSKFIELLDKFCTKNGGEWLYKKVEEMDLDYVEYKNKMRVKATKANKPGIAFLVDKMTFLPQEFREKLNHAGHCAENVRNKKSTTSASETY